MGTLAHRSVQLTDDEMNLFESNLAICMSCRGNPTSLRFSKNQGPERRRPPFRR